MALYSLPNRYCYSGKCLSVFYLGQYVNRSHHSALPRKYLIATWLSFSQDKGIHVILGMFDRNAVARKMICEVINYRLGLILRLWMKS